MQLLFLGDSITESWRGTDGGQPCNANRRSSCSGWVCHARTEPQLEGCFVLRVACGMEPR